MNVTKNKKIKRKEEVKFIFNQFNIDIVNNYINQDKNLNKSELTIYPLKRTAIIFLAYLEKNNINIKNLDINIIKKYLKTIPETYSIYTKKNQFKYLKDFLIYLYDSDIISEKIWLVIPNVKINNYCKIPSVFLEEDIRKIFNEIDRSNYTGKLIYAIALMALRYGLRIIDIKNLKFENIDWKHKKINIIQSKTKKELQLPLLDDVADALIDYIKNARVDCSEKYIFVNLKGKQYSINTNFYTDFNIYVQKAKLNISKDTKKGIHSFRHSIASRLLNENIPLPIISSILGHTSTLSTTNYLKIDNNQLKKCCLYLEDTYEK